MNAQQISIAVVALLAAMLIPLNAVGVMPETSTISGTDTPESSPIVSPLALPPPGSAEYEMLKDVEVRLVESFDAYLENEGKPSLTAAEQADLTNILITWIEPVGAATMLYLLAYMAILTHAMANRRWRWAATMLILAGVFPGLCWFSPLLYTRHHIAKDRLQHQLPIMALQILPTTVWWFAYADVAEWFARVQRWR